MVNCSFCKRDIKPGTGKLYIKKDSTKYNFCSNKCEKNMIKLGRIPREQKWVTKKQ